eukprot:scaffold9600_cov65-Phaeocystis_antarctica.AAC.1
MCDPSAVYQLLAAAVLWQGQREGAHQRSTSRLPSGWLACLIVARVGKAVGGDLALGMWCVKGRGNHRVYRAGSYKSRGTRCAAACAEREASGLRESERRSAAETQLKYMKRCEARLLARQTCGIPCAFLVASLAGEDSCWGHAAGWPTSRTTCLYLATRAYYQQPAPIASTPAHNPTSPSLVAPRPRGSPPKVRVRGWGQGRARLTEGKNGYLSSVVATTLRPGDPATDLGKGHSAYDSGQQPEAVLTRTWHALDPPQPRPAHSPTLAATNSRSPSPGCTSFLLIREATAHGL